MTEPTLRIRILAFVFALLCAPQLLKAQTNWLRSAGGSNLDEALDVAYTSSGNHYYTTGGFSGNCNFTSQTLASSGLSDGFIAKYEDDGSPVWAKKFGGTSSDKSVAVVADNSGSAYVCGYYNGTATFGSISITASDSSDIFIAKYNGTGDIVWVKSAGGPNNDAAAGIALDLSGNVYVTGIFRGTANFGSNSLTSMNYASSSNASADVFITKLDNNGNFLWAKKGSTNGDEKATDICTDGQGGIYVCGQFSDDITFDAVHPNTIDNAGFVVKYNASGQEQWFSRLAATQILPHALRSDTQNNIIVTGESIGQILIESTNTLLVPTTNSQSIFVAKYSSSGNISWATEDGSVSYVTSRAIATGTQNEIYITGMFDCIFTEYSDELGDGLFNSAGYRDIFVARFSSTGTREWMRQYGGPREDYCSGIANGTAADHPIIAGSFEKYFHAPGSEPGFNLNPTNFEPGVNDDLDNPNSGAGCGYGDYGSYVHLKAFNNKDIFIGNLVDLGNPHYDYYSRGDCSYPIVEPCAHETNTPLECNDEVTACGSASLFFVTNTGSQDWIGPAYDWQWSNNSSDEYIIASTTGWYWVESEREDGCASFIDSIYVTILEEPVPLITDDEGINLLSPPEANPILLCAPDEVQLTGSNEENLDGWWTDPLGNIIEQETITASEGGPYQYHILADNGCEEINTVQVEFVEPLEEIDPLLQFNDSNQPVNDTLVICGNDYITTELIDLLEQEEFAIYADAIWQIAIDTGYYPPYQGFESYTWAAQQAGWHYITATPFTFAPEPCPPDTVWYPAQTLSVYIELLDDPNPQPQISGDNTFCPGDTILLVATNALSYTWNGPNIIYLSEDSVLVTQPGNYSVSSFEEFENGCNSTGVDGINIQPIAQPVITGDPISHVICPGDSVLLTCQPAQNYQWIGPLGAELGNTQSIYTTQPGSYLCVATISGCAQESNVIEVQNYATPYILAMPGTDLCATGVVTLIAQASPVASIIWLDPLSGSSPSINVFEPDTYSASITFCGIETIATVEITESSPEATITPLGDFLCPGGSVTLSANAGMASYQWSPGGQNTQQIVVTQAGTYYVSVENDLGCEALSDDFVVTVYNISSPAATDINACLNEQVTFNATGQGIYWTNEINGPVVANGNSYNYGTASGPDIVYAYASDANCSSLPNEVLLNIYPSSTLFIEPMDTTYCAGESFVIATQDPPGANIQYEWTHPDGSTSDDPQITIDASVPSDNGLYILQAGDFNCDIEPDSIYIVVENPVNEALVSDPVLQVCIASQIFIFTESEASDYSWETPQGTFTTQEIIIDESDYDDEGNYILTVPGDYCEFNTDTIKVDVVAYPEFDLNDSLVYCSGGYLTAHVPPGYDLYQWSTGGTTAAEVMPSDGFIAVTVTNLPSCSKRDSIQVGNVDCLETFPNIFSPDGDGKNEYMDFGWLRIPIEEVQIYNRWGNLIKHLENAPFIWNGTNDNNQRVSEGTYYYVIVSGNPGGKFDQLSGYITVIFGEGRRN
jgi:gliding motility-associated-like protein